MLRVVQCVLMLVAAMGVPYAQARSAVPQPSVVRYHFGDDAGWASPNFNDSGWSVAQQDGWPAPAYYSSGFVWVRFQVRVRRDAAEPLAIRVETSGTTWSARLVAEEVFVNGTPVGRSGGLPPDVRVNIPAVPSVFDIPAGLARPGTVAHIALRIWYPPFARGVGATTAVHCTFDQARALHAEQDLARTRALVRNLPGLILDGIIFVVGCLVLFLGRFSRSRELLLYGAMLATLPLVPLSSEVAQARLVGLSVPEFFLFRDLSQLPAMIVTVLFIWGIHDFRDVWLKRVAVAAVWIFVLGQMLAAVPTHPIGIVGPAHWTSSIALQAFDVIVIGANLWVLFVLRRNRLVAFAMTLPALGSLVSAWVSSGQEVFTLALFLSGLFLSVALALNAWKEWRAGEALRTEFEAAREVQQHLVAPPVDVPGFRIESVYVPARHVGGDFFRVVPEEDGSVLVVVGDVSGKGLKAALTVSAVIGALRTMPALGPARVLAALNRGLVGQMQYGFATCLCARIAPNGTMTIANAGHLSPYCNGDEIELDAGLPLGISEAAEYSDVTVQLKTGGRLMFLSDGVVEARSTSGELFGFERTREISGHTAEQIAQAAQAFGQEDDITVLTLTLAAPQRDGKTSLAGGGAEGLVEVGP